MGSLADIEGSAEKLVWLRRKKVHDAYRNLTYTVSNPNEVFGKLLHAIQFWPSQEGVAWYMKKNKLDPDELQAEFDELKEPPFIDDAELQQVIYRLQVLGNKFREEVKTIIGEAGFIKSFDKDDGGP